MVGTEVIGLVMSGEKVRGVQTTQSTVHAAATLLCTGAWGANLWETAGVQLPVHGRRHELVLVEPPTPLPAGLPWLIDVDDGIHARAADAPLALLGGFLGEDHIVDPDTYQQRADPDWIARVISATASAFGFAVRGARIHRGWAGLYPGTPDRHPIIDRVGDGLYVAVGFAGTGLMMSPAAGLLAAELVIDGRLHSISPTALSADRFERSRLDAEPSGF